MRTVAGLLLLAGCDTLFGLQTVPRDGAAIDAPRDAPPPDAPPGMTCAGSLLRHCEPTATIAGVTLVIGSGGTMFVDTDSAINCHVLSQSGGPDVCALAYDVVQVDGTIIATGSRPLALYAMSSITVSGTIDVSSHARMGTIGAGANVSTCTGAPGASDTSVGQMHAGGGAGASFGTRGGAGGAGENTAITAMPGPSFSGTLVVRGGCRGGDGGRAFQQTLMASGGPSGGGLYIATNGGATIEMNGKLLANGQGGDGGPGNLNGNSFLGGGGGGTGGLIIVEGTVTVATGGLVMATGGGGGGGSYASSAGGPGLDPDPTQPLLAAGGGQSGISGTGNGGGGAAKTAAGDGAYSTTGAGGGGGGGGGAGIVRLPANATIIGTVVP